MAIVRVSPRLYKLILDEAAKDGVSLGYGADRLFDRLLESDKKLKELEAAKPKVAKVIISGD
ncbi:hypothetical protein ES705_39475 [subsurface metagenome]